MRIVQLVIPLKERVNQFCLLAFLPLPVIAYFGIVRVVVPVYAFIILLLKRDKLSLLGQSTQVQKTFGTLLVIISLFAYFLIVRMFPALADPYGIPNYVLHLIGLFLVFFSLPALKEAFSSVFLMVATASSFFISESLKPSLSPLLIPLYMRLMNGLVSLLGFPITSFFESRLMILHTWKGDVATVFDWGCVGIYSTMIFSIILVVILAEERGAIRTKLTWSIIGIAGTNIVNIFRILIIFLTDYAYGAEAGAQVHYLIGYALFIAWLTFFFVAMDKKPFSKQKAQKPTSQPTGFSAEMEQAT